MPAPAISIRDLAKSYGTVRAVRGISLDVAAGEVFGFLGLNGAGKTTTIRTLFDLIRPDSGSAWIFGIDCQKESRKARARAGYCPGELGLYPDMTGDELLRLTALLGGAEVSIEWRSQLCERLELTPSDLRRRLREYSTGMKRKLGLIQALQSDPPLLVLDEPTEGLDPLVQRALPARFLELSGSGRAVVKWWAVRWEVERLCDRIAVIRNGEIVLLSTVEQARRRSGRTIRLHFERPVDGIDLPAGTVFVEKEPQRWTLRVDGDAGALIRAVAPLPLRDVEILEPSLEDVLQSFYREAS